MYREPLGRERMCSLSASRTPFFSHLMVTGGWPWAWQSKTAGSCGSTVTSLGSVMKDNSLKHKTPGGKEWERHYRVGSIYYKQYSHIYPVYYSTTNIHKNLFLYPRCRGKRVFKCVIFEFILSISFKKIIYSMEFSYLLLQTSKMKSLRIQNLLSPLIRRVSVIKRCLREEKQ